MAFPLPSPSSDLKVPSLSTSTTLHGGDVEGKDFFFPLLGSVNHQKGPLEQSASINFVVDCGYHIKSKLRCCYSAQFLVRSNKQLL